jgi:hypothetical protein
MNGVRLRFLVLRRLMVVVEYRDICSIGKVLDGRGKQKSSGKSLFKCHFLHDNSHVDFSVIELGSPH